MTIPVCIQGCNGRDADVDINPDEKNGIIAAVRSLKTYENTIKFFVNTTYGIDMNVASVFTGTPIDIHDGIDKTQWTASSVAGSWNFNNSNNHAKEATVEIDDYTSIGAGETVTVVTDQGTVTAVEGTDYTAETSNTVTAGNLASALDGEDYISASSDGAVVTIIADDGYDITNVSDDSGGNITSSARAIKGSSVTNGATAQFAKGSSQDLTNYTAITVWIYITRWDTGGVKDLNLYGWDTGTGLKVGTQVNLGDYVNTQEFSKWHKITIPLDDMELTGQTLDSFRLEVVETGPGQAPNFWLDYFQIQESGSSFEFSIEPELGTWLHVKEFNITIVDTMAGTLADATMPYLSYNKILNIPKLSNGITYQRTQSEQVSFSVTVQQLVDFLQMAGSKIIGSGSDGTTTWVLLRLRMTEPLILKSENRDKVSFTVNDDLSGLDFFRITAGCGTETRE